MIHTSMAMVFFKFFKIWYEIVIPFCINSLCGKGKWCEEPLEGTTLVSKDNNYITDWLYTAQIMANN